MAAPPPLPIADGRRFGCTRCGNCCVEDGFVYMNAEEVAQIAGHLQLSVGELWARYDVQWDREAESAVLEAKGGAGCPLLDADRRCTAHPVKPAQCQTWPFWPEMLDERSEWQRAKGFCRGLDAPDGRLYPRDEIIQIRDLRRVTDESISS